MRTIVCPRCNGAGERCSPIAESWHRCITCNGTGSVVSGCTIARAAIHVDEPTPLASVILDTRGTAVDL